MEFTREQATRAWVVEHWPHQDGAEFRYAPIDHPDGGWMRLACRCGASHVTNDITEAYTRDRLVTRARGLGEPWGDAIAAMLEADKRSMREAWNAWGHLLSVGDPADNCGECGTLSEANYAATCSIHGPAGGALWLAMRQLAERIDACQCGHRVDEHESEDSTHCMVDGCSCRVMKLRGEA